jgi:hypothetical protein
MFDKKLKEHLGLLLEPAHQRGEPAGLPLGEGGEEVLLARKALGSPTPATGSCSGCPANTSWL